MGSLTLALSYDAAADGRRLCKGDTQASGRAHARDGRVEGAFRVFVPPVPFRPCLRPASRERASVVSASSWGCGCPGLWPGGRWDVACRDYVRACARARAHACALYLFSLFPALHFTFTFNSRDSLDRALELFSNVFRCSFFISRARLWETGDGMCIVSRLLPSPVPAPALFTCFPLFPLSISTRGFIRPCFGVESQRLFVVFPLSLGSSMGGDLSRLLFFQPVTLSSPAPALFNCFPLSFPLCILLSLSTRPISVPRSRSLLLQAPQLFVLCLSALSSLFPLSLSPFSH